MRWTIIAAAVLGIVFSIWLAEVFVIADPWEPGGEIIWETPPGISIDPNDHVSLLTSQAGYR